MSIAYAAIIKRDVCIASGPEPNPSINQSLKRLCAQISSGSVHQLDQGKNVIKVLSEANGMNYCCVAESSCDGRRTLQFLEELQRQWVRKYGSQPPPFSENQKNQEFGPIIQSALSSFNSQQAQKINVIKENILQAQETMAKNLEEALRRGEKLEDMEQKANNLNEHAHEFERGAKTLKNKMCWQKYQWYLLGALIAIVVIVIIVLIAVYAGK